MQEYKNKVVQQTLPGSIINLLFEYAMYTNNKEYSSSEISDHCDGVLIEVLSRHDNKIKVLYKTYDHHNLPTLTTILKIQNSRWVITKTTEDWSRTKYSHLSN